jgi:predicted MFS family arabinose efflux permease
MQDQESPSMRLLYWFALGTFAIGTEGFMIAPLLPGLGQDLSVSLVAAGQLVTVFTLSYAFSSPILTALTGSIGRRNLLIGSMIAFSAANLLAALATDYWLLMAARVLLALAAGLYVPNANALAGAVVRPQHRGRALAIVSGGTSIAVALGVPISALLGHSFGWRTTFLIVAGLSVLATAGLLFGLDRTVGAGLPVASLRERLAVTGNKPVLLSLVVTLLWAAGAYTVYTYLAAFLASGLGIEGAHVGIVLFVWGVAAAVGVTFGGALNDRFGSKQVILSSLALLATAFLTMSISVHLLSPAAARVPVLGAIIVWGLAAWSFFPAQQARLLSVAGVRLASVVLSLNASFMFAGFAAGAALGAATISRGSALDLGWVGAASVVAALGLAYRDKRNDNNARSGRALPKGSSKAWRAWTMIFSECPARSRTGQLAVWRRRNYVSLGRVSGAIILLRADCSPVLEWRFDTTNGCDALHAREPVSCITLLA